MWTWDEEALLAEVAALKPEAPVLLKTRLEEANGALERVLRIAPEASGVLTTTRRRLETLQALASVATLHERLVRSSFGINVVDKRASHEIHELTMKLEALAGSDWATTTQAATINSSELQVQEIRSVLRQSLASVRDGDLSAFQQLLEQMLASLPNQALVVPVQWMRGAPEHEPISSDGHESEQQKEPYLQYLLELSNPPASALAESLSDAQVFQDAKDIQRDELEVNGELVAGHRGYETIVRHLQQQIHAVLATQIGKRDLKGSSLADTTAVIARHILHASNRTESGGSSYEMLSWLLSQSETDHVLIRPDSASATPLGIHMDVGAYTDGCISHAPQDELLPGEQSTLKPWAFGVRVTLSAETQYLICDALDPTLELHAVKTTYTNRLAFPLDLTPFHHVNHMRCDSGAVTITLLRSPVSQEEEEEEEDQVATDLEDELQELEKDDEEEKELEGELEELQTQENEEEEPWDDLL